MLSWIHEFLSPFAYLRIRQGERFLSQKRWLDLLLPFIISIALVYMNYKLVEVPTFTGTSGLLNAFAPALQLFAGFFIAALAAAATLQREGLDDEMKGGKTWVYAWSNSKNRRVPVQVTRRQYLCRLLGYLSFLCILFVISASIAQVFSIADWSKFRYISNNIFYIARIAATFLLYFLISSIFILSLVAIRFMSDRINSMDEDFQ